MSVERWACKRCCGVFARADCAVRLGIIECPICLRSGWVGLLEPLREPDPAPELARLADDGNPHA